MADPNDKVPENAAGRFFVDASCIDCDLCREKAPQNFARNAAGRRSYVYRQPGNDFEEAACKAALDECPVEAIGTSA
ncbi:MAG: ferredoxin [Isosphaeraceae bacterium]